MEAVRNLSFPTLSGIQVFNKLVCILDSRPRIKYGASFAGMTEKIWKQISSDSLKSPGCDDWGVDKRDKL